MNEPCAQAWGAELEGETMEHRTDAPKVIPIEERGYAHPESLVSDGVGRGAPG